MPKISIRPLVLFISIAFIFALEWRALPLARMLESQYIFDPRAQDFFNVHGEGDPGKALSEATSTYRNGPQRTGLYRGELKLPLKVTWRIPDLFAGIHTASKATPAVDRSGIYFGTDLGIFYKASPEGKVLWSFRTESGSQGIHGTALLDGNHVYFGNYAGYVYCLDKTTGTLVWETEVSDAAGSSPLLFGEQIIFSSEFGSPREGYVLSLNAQTGKKNWVSEYFEEQVHSSPTLAAKERILGVGDNAGAFRGVDTANGDTVWRFHATAPIKSTAAYVGGRFCFSSWDRTFRCLEALDGHELFSLDLEGLSQSSPAVDEDREEAYVSSGSGFLYKISLREKKILQQVSLQMAGKENHFSQPSPVLIKTATKSYVLTPCEDTKICLFDSKVLVLMQKLDVGGFISGSLVLQDGAVYFNINDQGLVRVN